MIKIGLTGNICSGHDKVSMVFKTFGVPVFDADVALKFLLNYREDIIRNIRIQFGDVVYDKGALNSNKFITTQKFDRLIDIAELELLKLYESWRFANKDASYTVFKSSILFERKLDKNMNYTISSFKPKDERAMSLSKTGMSVAQSYDVIGSEMDELMKNQMSTWIIHNYDDSNLSLISQVKKIHDSIESKSIKNLLNKFDSGPEARNIFT